MYVFLFDYAVYGNQSTFSKENELTCRFCLTTQKLKKIEMVVQMNRQKRMGNVPFM